MRCALSISERDKREVRVHLSRAPRHEGSQREQGALVEVERTQPARVRD